MACVGWHFVNITQQGRLFFLKYSFLLGQPINSPILADGYSRGGSLRVVFITWFYKSTFVKLWKIKISYCVNVNILFRRFPYTITNKMKSSNHQQVLPHMLSTTKKVKSTLIRKQVKRYRHHHKHHLRHYHRTIQLMVMPEHLLTNHQI